MTYRIAFRSESLELELVPERVLGERSGPEPLSRDQFQERIETALRHPSDALSLGQVVVPGDRVVIACDVREPEVRIVLEEMSKVLTETGVESIAWLIPGDLESVQQPFTGVEIIRHDPEDRNALAYLASSSQGAPIHLNRVLTDADSVLSVGILAPEREGGPRFRGPWTTVYPTFSHSEAIENYEREIRLPKATSITEPSEVGWLLGNLFQVALIPARVGFAEVIAGLAESVNREGARFAGELWTFQTTERADVVAVGVGRPDRETTIPDLVDALDHAHQVVRRVGKIVALSRASGAFGPALSALVASGDPRRARQTLKEYKDAPDFELALRLANVLNWADVYLLSELDSGDVEELGMIALDRPEDCRKLLSQAESLILFSQAERMKAALLEKVSADS